MKIIKYADETKKTLSIMSNVHKYILDFQLQKNGTLICYLPIRKIFFLFFIYKKLYRDIYVKKFNGNIAFAFFCFEIQVGKHE